MTRFIAVVAALSAVLSAGLVVGCDLGAVPPAGGFQDSGSGTTGDATTDAIGLGSCTNPVAHNPAGNHNQGMACITSACHEPDALGAGAPAFLIAGTVFTSSAAGAAGAPGASVLITDGSATYLVTTGSDGSGAGNFYVMATATETTIMGGGSAAVSSCPNLMMMTRSLVKPASQGSANDGNCNRSGCHGAAGDDGGQGPIAL